MKEFYRREREILKYRIFSRKVKITLDSLPRHEAS
jgi:hypothetical protein